MANGLEASGNQLRVVSIGDAKWDRVTRQLVLRGVPVKLPFRAAAVFAMLVDARGDVVSREELERQVWDGAQMDYSVLSQCIKTLRRALDPAPGGSSYIETVARVGYKLSVEVIEEAAPVSAESAPSAPRSGKRLWWVWVAAAAAVLAIAVAGTLLYRQAERRRQADLLIDKAALFLRRSTVESGAQAVVLLREALTIVPNYPRANASLAEAAARVGQFTFEHALDVARRAAQDDDNCSDCHSILGYILATRMWRWEEALPHLQRAVELNPTRASHRLFLAEWLMIQGRLPEASQHAEEAVRLDPTNPSSWATLAAVRYFQQRYPEAVHEGERAASLDFRQPSSFYWQYRSQMQLGEDLNVITGRAKSVAGHSSDIERTVTQFSSKFQAILKTSGRRGVAQGWLDEVSTGRALMVHRYNRAIWYMWIGEHDAALAELEAGVKSRPYHMIYTGVDPIFAPLRNNPRFHKVLESIGLKSASAIQSNRSTTPAVRSSSGTE